MATAIFVGAMVLFWIFKVWVFKRLKRAAEQTPTAVDDFLLELFNRAILPILYAGASYLAFTHLDLPKSWDRAAAGLFKIILVIQAVRVILAVLTFFIRQSWIKLESPGSFATKSIVNVARFLVWSIAVIFLLDNLGFDVNAVVAGLGIGGVAVALAAQTILGDLFNYFVIIFDRPFVEGDFIIVDDFMGEIERIGIKSTRIRSLSGEQLVMSNTNLTSSRVRNFKRMQKRRALFTLGVVYQTPIETMRRIPQLIKSVIESTPEATFDRAHFKSFADSSLLIEAVYYVNVPDYNKYMDAQQAINFGIMEAFQREGIEFAYPTQTVYNYGELPQIKLVKN